MEQVGAKVFGREEAPDFSMLSASKGSNFRERMFPVEALERVEKIAPSGARDGDQAPDKVWNIDEGHGIEEFEAFCNNKKVLAAFDLDLADIGALGEYRAASLRDSRGRPCLEGEDAERHRDLLFEEMGDALGRRWASWALFPLFKPDLRPEDEKLLMIPVPEVQEEARLYRPMLLPPGVEDDDVTDRSDGRFPDDAEACRNLHAYWTISFRVHGLARKKMARAMMVVNFLQGMLLAWNIARDASVRSLTLHSAMGNGCLLNEDDPVGTRSQALLVPTFAPMFDIGEFMVDEAVLFAWEAWIRHGNTNAGMAGYYALHASMMRDAMPQTAAILSVAALEQLVHANPGEAVSSKTAQNIAVLFPVAERQDVSDRVKKYYEVRSSAAHESRRKKWATLALHEQIVFAGQAVWRYIGFMRRLDERGIDPGDTHVRNCIRLIQLGMPEEEAMDRLRPGPAP